MKIGSQRGMVPEFAAKIATGNVSYSRMVHLVFDFSPLAICVFDSSFSMIDCNEATLRLFETQDKKEILNNFMMFSIPIQPDGFMSGEAARKVILQAIESGDAHSQWVHRTKSGESIPSEVILKKVDIDNTFVLFLYIRDLRDEVRSQILVKEVTERDRIMLNETPVCSIFFDDSFRVVTCNPAALALFGEPSEESFIDNFFSLNPTRQRDGSFSYNSYIGKMQETINTGKLVFEWEHMTSAGERLPVDTTLVRVEYKGSYRIIGYLRDLREQKAALRETKLAERKLKEAKKLAEDSARIKSEFLANMSHEIRTPMNGIIGLTELALQHETRDSQRFYLDKIYTSAKSLLRIINDILDFSKIEAGKLSIEKAPLSIHSLLSDVQSTKSLIAAQKGLSLDVNISDEIDFEIIGDSLRLSQVLLNLTDNALKFTSKGSVTIDVSLESIKGDTVKLLFAIRDTGIGMTKSEVSKLFRAFQQADASTSRKYGGTGLGLVISKSLVRQMGGKIWLESTYGSGTAFFFTIKAVKVSSADLLVDEKGADDDFVVPAELKGRRILLAEDNEINRIIVNELLDDAGFLVESASNGLEAVNLLRENEFDLVLMDIQMPEMDGFTATREIRKNNSSLPIVAMTANAMQGDREKSLEAGMNDHITKPISRNTTLETVCKWLS